MTFKKLLQHITAASSSCLPNQIYDIVTHMCLPINSIQAKYIMGEHLDLLIGKKSPFQSKFNYDQEVAVFKHLLKFTSLIKFINKITYKLFARFSEESPA